MKNHKQFDVGAINAPDNRGTEFIIGFMQNYNDPDREPMDNELFITTSKTTPTNVLVQAPRYPSLGLNESFSVIAGTVKQLNIKSDIRLIGTSMEAKGILVTSDQEIVVYGVNKDRYSNDAYVSLPTDVLGTDYFAVCWYPQTRQCQILIAATQDNTTVAITLGPGMQARRNPVTWQGTNYYKDDTITVTMDRLDTFQITNEDEDLTGSRITSDKPISVFSGNQKTIISSGTSSDHLVEQLTPVNTWGKRFATVPIPERTVGDMFKFVASEDNTQVSINCNGYSTTVTLTTAGSYHIEDIASDKYCYVTADKAILTVQFCKSQTSSSSSEKSDPMMMLIPPVELYGADYTFSTPKYSQGSYENFFMFTIKDSLKDGLLLDGEPFPASTVYNSITGINLVAGYVPVTDGSHVIRHTSTIAIFGGYLYGKAPYETYGFSTGTRLASINGVCINTTTVVGDDDDGDGLFDEDCAIPFPVNGNWSEWSLWSFCSVNCTMIRSRTCTNPAPAYDGEQCSGNSTDESDCTPCTDLNNSADIIYDFKLSEIDMYYNLENKFCSKRKG
ncbi:hypothetical protein KUTeg_012245 [Tegillarca granosa]|uniref:IgGFc-binding protein N-terminal domain-containing protein n=1 Tax=Tegillarca granosa TaxID=220873 RepID=A0ABQ9F455_TEGGR|nr:hypothetical protein KUTeg_012245 [Tegillarca granosa]